MLYVLLQKAGFKENMLVLQSVTQHEDRTCEESTHFTAGDTNQVQLKQIKQMVGYQQHILLFERKQGNNRNRKKTFQSNNMVTKCTSMMSATGPKTSNCCRLYFNAIVDLMSST